MPYTVLFIDGNHENFDRLNAYPEEMWNGGRVHRIGKNILHLMRGQVFEIEGKRIFAMGGANSIDKYARAEGVSWWRAEIPSESELAEARRNLDKYGNCVDLIITHTAPRTAIAALGYDVSEEEKDLIGFFDAELPGLVLADHHVARGGDHDGLLLILGLDLLSGENGVNLRQKLIYEGIRFENHIRNAPYLPQLAEHIYEEYTNKAESWQCVVTALLTAFFQLLLRKMFLILRPLYQE